MPNMELVDPSILYSLFKGEVGTRKSTQAITFPKPIYFFSYDQKMEGLLLPMRHWGINPRDIHYDDYFDWNAGLKKLEQLQTNCPYKTIVVDTITTLADAINRQTLKVKSGKSTDNTGKRIAGIPVNSIEDFNAEDSALKEMVAITKDIQRFHHVNIILIGHIIQKEHKDSAGKTHMSRILVTAGKAIAQKIPAVCGEVYHFNIKTAFEADKGGQYSLLTTHTGDDFARTSLPLSAEIVFGSDPLYDNYLKPAIESMKVVKSVENVSAPPQGTTSKFAS